MVRAVLPDTARIQNGSSIQNGSPKSRANQQAEERYPEKDTKPEMIVRKLLHRAD
jgi:hypothetical protein